MATNRAFDLDEAMHRRITLCHEFRRPDPHFRQKIWNVHLPQDIKMRDQLDLKELAWQYELTGGFIKNAVLSALSLAVARNVEDLQITQADLEKGAKLQLRSHLQMTDFDRRVVPLFGLDGLVLTPLLRKILEQIIQFEKARNVLFSQWGFDEKLSYGQGMAALFHGPPGTGKSITAEAIGFQLGKPLKVINTAEVLSKYVGESSKNIDAIFKDARANDSIIVFDEADGLFGARTAVSNSTDRYANIDVGLLLYNIERFPGLIILTTNLFKNIDEAFLRRMKFILEFDIPDRELREQLWKKLSPAKMPLAEEVNFFKLAARYTISGGHIKNAVFKAAAKAALRSEQERKVTMQDLMEAAESEVEGSKSKKIGF